MGWACNTHEEDEKLRQNFSRKNFRGRDHLEDLSVDGKILK
jgi:hypothetical protein